MGRTVEALAGEYGCDIAGVIDPGSLAHGGGPDPGRRGGRDVAIYFSAPDSVTTNVPVLAQRGISLVVGTTGWGSHEAAVRKTVDPGGGATGRRRAFSPGR